MAKTKEEYMSDFKKWGLLGGRPKAFKSPKEMGEKIAEWLVYLNTRTKKIVTKQGNVVEIDSPAPILIESFCTFCGITPQTFYEYHKKPEFLGITEFLRTKVQKYLAETCVEGPSGNKADFILKNGFPERWQDRKVDELDLAKDLKQALVGFVPNGDKDGLSDLDTRVKPEYDIKKEPEYDNKDGLSVGGGDGTSEG